MARAHRIAALAALVVAAPFAISPAHAATDDASSSKPAARSATKSKAKAKQTSKQATKQAKISKQARRESTKVSANHHFKLDSHPEGWQWPPSASILATEKTCEAKLDQLGVTWKPAQREGRVVDPVTLPDANIGGVTYVTPGGSAPHMMDCQLALALATFAPQLAAVGVKEVHFGSLYRWTKVRAFGKTTDALSRHGLGLAMDVISFVDGNGHEAVVGRDYKAGDPLLLDVERAVNDSHLFRILLTPKNDPVSHRDHFHLEANPDFSPLGDPAVAADDAAADALPDDPDRVDI